MSTIKKARSSDVFQETALAVNSVLHLTHQVTKYMLTNSDDLPDSKNVTPELIQNIAVKSVKQHLLLED